MTTTLATEHGWHMTRHASKSLLRHLFRTDKKIGEPSKFGVVHRVLVDTGNKYQFVMKTIKIPRQFVTGFSLNFNTLKTKINRNNNRNKYLDLVNTFKTEVGIGSLKRIGEVGPRIFAWRITPTGGEYIMDNVQLGNSEARVFPLAKVIDWVRSNPSILDNVLHTITKFQQITKGFHGDLHKNNIQIVKCPDGIYTMIIDYGSWRSKNTAFGKAVTTHHGMNVFRPSNKGSYFIKNSNMIARIIKN